MVLSLLVSDGAAEDRWVDHFTGQEVDTSLGLHDGGRQENCALLTPAWGARWVDWRCVVNKASPIVCACEHSQVTSLNPFVKSKQKAFILEPIFLNIHFEINL